MIDSMAVHMGHWMNKAGFEPWQLSTPGRSQMPAFDRYLDVIEAACEEEAQKSRVANATDSSLWQRRDVPFYGVGCKDPFAVFWVQDRGHFQLEVSGPDGDDLRGVMAGLNRWFYDTSVQYTSHSPGVYPFESGSQARPLANVAHVASARGNADSAVSLWLPHIISPCADYLGWQMMSVNIFYAFIPLQAHSQHGRTLRAGIVDVGHLGLAWQGWPYGRAADKSKYWQRFGIDPVQDFEAVWNKLQTPLDEQHRITQPSFREAVGEYGRIPRCR